MNVKSVKGNECSQHKSTIAIFSSSLPICSIHIFSNDTMHVLHSEPHITCHVIFLVKIYVATAMVLKCKERHDETQFSTKIAGKTSLGPSYFIL